MPHKPVVFASASQGYPLYCCDQSGDVSGTYVQLDEHHVIVPKEPTTAMREAFWRAHTCYEHGLGEMPDSGWRAMLRAAAEE